MHHLSATLQGEDVFTAMDQQDEPRTSSLSREDRNALIVTAVTILIVTAVLVVLLF